MCPRGSSDRKNENNAAEGSLKALVTGASGFIGSHLVEALLSSGHEVCCLARPTSNRRWLENLPLRWQTADFSDRDTLERIMGEWDWVFHVAGVIHAPDRDAYIRGNCLSTQNLLEACLRKNPRLQKFILVSSISAVGPSPRGCRLDESAPCLPISDYGRSKLQAEQIALDYSGRLPLTIIRPPNVIGARQRELYSAIRLIQHRFQPAIGSGEPQTSICYVNDLAKAMILAAEKPETSGQTYFVLHPRPCAWSEIIEGIARLLGKERYYLKIPYWIQWPIAWMSETIAHMRHAQPLASRENLAASRHRYWIYDGSRSERELGFSASIGLEEALRLTIDWYGTRGLI